uniref:Uncharacterized protein n=1 Tax=Cannabis sativa TaxID=3483 RepID=A0A803R8Y9_CANSA
MLRPASSKEKQREGHSEEGDRVKEIQILGFSRVANLVMMFVLVTESRSISIQLREERSRERDGESEEREGEPTLGFSDARNTGGIIMIAETSSFC